ncbi:unnamed protein product [Lactuca saligna]|uniref:Uncharacterized protein n=1 Tax=Lactuca saligna TaxID=75948 RepID=A0AA35Z0U5_LACSI|nr:unnamed protein product [Lactuca saligna]
MLPTEEVGGERGTGEDEDIGDVVDQTNAGKIRPRGENGGRELESIREPESFNAGDDGETMFLVEGMMGGDYRRGWWRVAIGVSVGSDICEEKRVKGRR